MSEQPERGVSTWWIVKSETAEAMPAPVGGVLGWVLYEGTTRDGREVFARPLSGPHAAREDAERVLAEFSGTRLYDGAYIVQRADEPAPIIEPHTTLPRDYPVEVAR